MKSIQIIYAKIFYFLKSFIKKYGLKEDFYKFKNIYLCNLSTNQNRIYNYQKHIDSIVL